MDLFVGREFFDYNLETATAYLLAHGADRGRIASINSASEIATFDMLNSITLFTDHVLLIEGYRDAVEGYQALQAGRFRLKHLPIWEESNWLPFEFDAPGLIGEGAITWVGSCHGLRRDLEDIAKRSPLRMADPLPHYDLKKGGVEPKFDQRQFSDGELVRWAWRCLHDGAKLALRENSILSGTPE